MTRKDYQRLAASLAECRPAMHPESDEDTAAISQWLGCRSAIADALAADNARFDRDRFMGACEK